jgi:hypothetical protein
MKTILLIIALIGFNATCSYAQNTGYCPCKKKMGYHHGASARQAKATTMKTVAASPSKTSRLSMPENRIAKAPEPCYMYRKNNIVVMECPGVFYDRDEKGVFEYSTDGTYLGYYPVSANSQPGIDNKTDENTNDFMAPQHTTIDHYKGTAPAGGNYCTRCTPQ